MTTSQTVVLKLCFDIIHKEYEYSLTGESTTLKDLREHMNLLLQATNLMDMAIRTNLLPIFLSITPKLIAHGVKDCKIVDEHLCLGALEVLNIGLAGAKASPCRTEITKQNLNGCALQICICLESLRSSSASALSSNMEHCCELCFDNYQLLLSTYYKNVQEDKSADSTPPNILSGPFLAQIIQSCVHFSTHPSKDISFYSLSCIQTISNFVRDTDTWRVYFPGTFCGLITVCQLGYKR